MDGRDGKMIQWSDNMRILRFHILTIDGALTPYILHDNNRWRFTAISEKETRRRETKHQSATLNGF